MASVEVVAADNSTGKGDNFLKTTVPSPPPSSSSCGIWRNFNYFGGPTYWSVVASLSFLCTGLLRAYTSPALLSIQNESPLASSSNLILVSASSSSSKKDVISWIASTPPLASFLGTILSGPLLQHWGRKRTLVLLSLVSTVGWLLVGNSWSISALLSGRALTGLASGLATATAPLYISEVVSRTVKKDGIVPTSGGFGGASIVNDRRGLLPGVMLATGILLGFILAHQVQVWRRLALIIALFPGVLAFLSVTIPESPFWLLHLSRKKSERDDEKEIKFDLEMEPVVPPPSSAKKFRKKKSDAFSEKTGLIPKNKSSPFSIPIYLRIGLLMLFQQWSGGNVLIYYLSEILTKNLPSSSSSSSHAHHDQVPVDESTIHQASLIIALVQFIGFFLALPLIDHPRVGRRFLLLISSVLMMMAHLFLGFHFHRMMIFREMGSNDHTNNSSSIQQQADHFNHDDNVVDNNVNFSPSRYDFVIRVSSLAVLLSCYSIGLGPIPFLFMENSPAALEGSSSSSCTENGSRDTNTSSSYLSSFASLVNHLALFLAVKGFPYLFHMDHHDKEEEQKEQQAMFHYGPDVTFWLFASVCWITALFTFYCVPADHSRDSKENDQVSSSL